MGFVSNGLCIKVTTQNSRSAANAGYLPAMELVLNYAKELGKELSDEHFGRALYQMYCG